MSNHDAIEKIESKLARGEIAPDYHVRQAIVNRYAENHGGLQLVGGVLVAVVGFSLVGWMGGVGIGLIAAQHLMNWHKKRSEDWRAIDSGRYGHLLTATEAKHYERIYGKGSLQAAKQGDYSHAGLEPDEAIDVPAEAVEDAKKLEATVEPMRDAAVTTDESAPVDATSADVGEAVVDDKDSSTPTPTPDAQHPTAPTDGGTPALCDRFAWAKDLLHFPAVLVWGAQGSGKTSFAAWLLHQRIAAGHSAWVCDPHKEFGQWNGLKCVGAGMDYEACDRAMIQFAHTVKHEYKTRSEQSNYKPHRETVLVEEFTQWSDRCENAGEFFKASLSDIRKIKKSVIFVSHDRSLVALGNAKGFSKARNNGLLELFLEVAIDPVTGEPQPAMKGKLKLPGKAAIEVEISPEMCGSMDFTQAIGVEAASAPEGSEALASDEQHQLRAKLEGLYQETNSVSDDETVSAGNETEERPDAPETNSVRARNNATARASAFSFDPETKIVSFPETETVSVIEAETMLFKLILEGYENRLPPNEIVKQSLKLGSDRYQEGRSLCCYLVRKHGRFDLLMHFRKWLEES